MSSDPGGLIPIGRFSALSQVSVVTLRHYAEFGVLTPAWTDPHSGYRYYRPAQIEQATLVRLLRHLDLGLTGSLALLGADPADAAQELRRHIGALEERGRNQHRVASYLINRLHPRKDAMTINVTTRTEPEQTVLMRTRTLSIEELHPFLGSVFTELQQVAGERGLEVVTGSAFTRFHGRVDEEHTSTVDACLPVRAPGGHPGTVTLPTVQVATAHIYDEMASYPALFTAYDAVARWAGDHGHDLIEPVREVYRELLVTGDDRDHFEIAWPISAEDPEG